MYVNNKGGYSEAQPEAPAEVTLTEVPPAKQSIPTILISFPENYGPINRCRKIFATHAKGGVPEMHPDVAFSVLEELRKGAMGTKKAAKGNAPAAPHAC